MPGRWGRASIPPATALFEKWADRTNPGCLLIEVRNFEKLAATSASRARAGVVTAQATSCTNAVPGPERNDAALIALISVLECGAKLNEPPFRQTVQAQSSPRGL